MEETDCQTDTSLSIEMGLCNQWQNHLTNPPLGARAGPRLSNYLAYFIVALLILWLIIIPIEMTTKVPANANLSLQYQHLLIQLIQHWQNASRLIHPTD